MKKIIQFEYDDQDDDGFKKNAARRAETSTEAYLVIHKIQAYMINKIKNYPPGESDIQQALNELNSIIEDLDINMDDLE